MNIYDVYDGTEKVGEVVEWSDGCVTMRSPRLSLGSTGGASMDDALGRFPEYTFVPHGSPPPEPDTGGWLVSKNRDGTVGIRRDHPFRTLLGTPQQARNLADKIRAVADEADGS